MTTKFDKLQKQLGQVTKDLYKPPKKDDPAPHITSYEKDFTNQIDLLYMPDDEGYKFAIVAVDPYDGTTDAEALKGRSVKEALEGLKEIYKRGILKQPERFELDDGAEFKGAFKTYFRKQGIQFRVSLPGRSRQNGLVERRNQTLARNLFERMTAQEILTGEDSKEWVDDMPTIIEYINSKVERKELPDDPLGKGEILPVGTKVRASLDKPVEVVSGDKLHGRFRSTDIRFSPVIRTVMEVKITPGQPVLYLLDDLKDKNKPELVGRTKQQLQIVTMPQDWPSHELIRGKPETYIPDKIIKKRKQKGKIEYLVHWRGFPPSQRTWEPRKTVIDTVPDLVEEFEEV